MATCPADCPICGICFCLLTNGHAGKHWCSGCKEAFPIDVTITVGVSTA